MRDFKVEELLLNGDTQRSWLQVPSRDTISARYRKHGDTRDSDTDLCIYSLL